MAVGQEASGVVAAPGRLVQRAQPMPGECAFWRIFFGKGGQSGAGGSEKFVGVGAADALGKESLDGAGFVFGGRA